jgi:hypothetical protein
LDLGLNISPFRLTVLFISEQATKGGSVPLVFDN